MSFLTEALFLQRFPTGRCSLRRFRRIGASVHFDTSAPTGGPENGASATVELILSRLDCECAPL